MCQSLECKSLGDYCILKNVPLSTVRSFGYVRPYQPEPISLYQGSPVISNLMVETILSKDSKGFENLFNHHLSHLRLQMHQKILPELLFMLWVEHYWQLELQTISEQMCHKLRKRFVTRLILGLFSTRFYVYVGVCTIRNSFIPLRRRKEFLMYKVLV